MVEQSNLQFVHRHRVIRHVTLSELRATVIFLRYLCRLVHTHLKLRSRGTRTQEQYYTKERLAGTSTRSLFGASVGSSERAYTVSEPLLNLRQQNNKATMYMAPTLCSMALALGPNGVEGIQRVTFPHRRMSVSTGSASNRNFLNVP